MLKSTAQIRFSELNMDRSTRRSKLFKKLNPLGDGGGEGRVGGWREK
ncbi:MAG: hypothetical protein ACMUEL_07565 [Flavobacteriales bacterium Tduv]